MKNCTRYSCFYNIFQFCFTPHNFFILLFSFMQNFQLFVWDDGWVKWKWLLFYIFYMFCERNTVTYESDGKCKSNLLRKKSLWTLIKVQFWKNPESWRLKTSKTFFRVPVNEFFKFIAVTWRFIFLHFTFTRWQGLVCEYFSHLFVNELS